jgi:uncharacterized membrane-anchored protein YhcB (DUF1043 family)
MDLKNLIPTLTDQVQEFKATYLTEKGADKTAKAHYQKSALNAAFFVGGIGLSISLFPVVGLVPAVGVLALNLFAFHANQDRLDKKQTAAIHTANTCSNILKQLASHEAAIKDHLSETLKTFLNAATARPAFAVAHQNGLESKAAPTVDNIAKPAPNTLKQGS